MIDEEQLLAWLRERAERYRMPVGAVYAGLAERIQRGEFDKEGGLEDGPHLVQS